MARLIDILDKFLDGVSDFLRLLRIHPSMRVAALHGAEPAASGASVPQDHYRGGAGTPALGIVGTLSCLADSVELQSFQQGLNPGVALATGRLDPEPLRLLPSHGAFEKRRTPLCSLMLLKKLQGMSLPSRT